MLVDATSRAYITLRARLQPGERALIYKSLTTLTLFYRDVSDIYSALP